MGTVHTLGLWLLFSSGPSRSRQWVGGSVSGVLGPTHEVSPQCSPP